MKISILIFDQQTKALIKMEIRHIHEVLDILSNSENQYSTESLIEEVKNRFGDQIHFTSCSENVFPADEIIPFLLSRNKIEINGNMITPLTPSCSH